MSAILKLILIAAMLFFAGCGGSSEREGAEPGGGAPATDLSASRDGTYQAESSIDKHLNKARLTLTIKDHRIVEAEFVGIDFDGSPKGEDYGRRIPGDEGSYRKAQNAVKANAAYGRQLVEEQDLAKVDAISGATVSYNQFVETVEAALAESRK